MPRLARLVVPDSPHHITPCAVRSMDIFAGDQDRKSCLSSGIVMHLTPYVMGGIIEPCNGMLFFAMSSTESFE